jgi:hypothetical protein
MATDHTLMIHKLMAFYDFKDKTLVSIGAGGERAINNGPPTKNRGHRSGRRRPRSSARGRRQGQLKSFHRRR